MSFAKIETAFELNEDLKECCILLGASKAVTTRFKTGVVLIPEEFWETIVIIPKDKNITHIKAIFGLIQSYLDTFEEYGYSAADPVLEYSYGEPRVIYAIFPGKLSFTQKLKKK